MRDASALQAALAMVQMPSLVREARRSALPSGMTFLLEVGAGDTKALKEAAELTSYNPDRLRAASGFYIEQILLTNNDDSFRVLGANMETSAADLRRHMALLLKWLHPDVSTHDKMNDQIDRSLFANRVTKAWEDLKTQDRRAAYALAQNFASRQKQAQPASRSAKRQGSSRRSRQQQHSKSKIHPAASRRKPRVRRFAMHWLGRESLFNRLVLFLKGQR